MKSEGLCPPKNVLDSLFELHLEKIRRSDGIYVVDVGWYIGDSTRKEIAFAEKYGKSVRYFSKEAGMLNEVIKQVDYWK